MDKNEKELLETVAQANQVLVQVETIFPFTLFPDTVTIDREKMTIAKRQFFRMAQISSTQFVDIQSIEAIVGPFFGSLKITSKFFINNPRTVNFLKRDDAINIQRLVQGFIIAREKSIDLSSIEQDELVEKLTDIGQGAPD